jgi:predicted nucleotidyltransferase
MSLAESMRDFVRVFEQLSFTYAVMGGLAVRIYGIPRPTYDVDFTVAIPRERLTEFYQACIALGYTVADPYLGGWVDRVAGMPLVKLRRYVAERGVDMDLFLAECDFQKELLRRRREIEFDGDKVWMVSPEDLILLKLLASRPRDFADITDVLFTQGELDEEYMHVWATRQGTLGALEKVLADRG